MRLAIVPVTSRASLEPHAVASAVDAKSKTLARPSAMSHHLLFERERVCRMSWSLIASPPTRLLACCGIVLLSSSCSPPGNCGDGHPPTTTLTVAVDANVISVSTAGDCTSLTADPSGKQPLYRGSMTLPADGNWASARCSLIAKFRDGKQCNVTARAFVDGCGNPGGGDVDTEETAGVPCCYDYWARPLPSCARN